jgi:hypothetical protein
MLPRMFHAASIGSPSRAVGLMNQHLSQVELMDGPCVRAMCVWTMSNSGLWLAWYSLEEQRHLMWLSLVLCVQLPVLCSPSHTHNLHAPEQSCQCCMIRKCAPACSVTPGVCCVLLDGVPVCGLVPVPVWGSVHWLVSRFLMILAQPEILALACCATPFVGAAAPYRHSGSAAQHGSSLGWNCRYRRGTATLLGCSLGTAGTGVALQHCWAAALLLCG